jgi:hypothetical protein
MTKVVRFLVEESIGHDSLHASLSALLQDRRSSKTGPRLSGNKLTSLKAMHALLEERWTWSATAVPAVILDHSMG